MHSGTSEIKGLIPELLGYMRLRPALSTTKVSPQIVEFEKFPASNKNVVGMFQVLSTCNWFQRFKQNPAKEKDWSKLENRKKNGMEGLIWSLIGKIVSQSA